MNRKYPRAPWHDYNYGIYFVTVVTKNRCNYFGSVVGGDMVHSDIGAFLLRTIEQCGLHYKDVVVDKYVVMPNHFHAIIAVWPRHAATLPLDESIDAMKCNIGCLRAPNHLEANDDFAQRNHHNARLSVVVGGIKSATMKFANKNGMPFAWQSNFHDHIIRNQQGLDKITDYIEHNPQRWEEDTFFCR